MSAPKPHIFAKAAEILRSSGWIQGSYRGPRGYCMMGALNRALRENGDDGIHCDDSAEASLLETILRERGWCGVYLHNWNDEQFSSEPVLALLDEAVLRSGGQP